MATLILVCLSSALLSGFLAGFVFLGIALYLLMLAAGQTPTLAQLSFATLVCLAPVLSALLLGNLLERFCFETRQLKLVGALAITLCLLLGLNSDHLSLYLSTLLSLSSGSNPALLISALIAVSSTVVFCAGIAAACLMLCTLCIEAPLVWWSRAHLFEQVGKGLRPLVIMIMCSLASYLLVGLYAAEFAPTQLFNP